ncbi:MAG: alcohol dehydrogenase catalytic domain-containing protein [Steroidobacteraceae bacterium]
MPQAGPGEICIEIAYGGICGTDLHLYHWSPFMRYARLPVVLGHELAGRVVEIGAGVTRAAVGDRVTVDSHIPCGRCYACLNEAAHVCENTRYPGIHINGGFASHVVLPERIVWKLHDSLPDEIGTIMEPFGIAVHASTAATGVAGQNVVISGCGPIGLMNVAVARALGANRVIALDVNALRLQAAERLGADAILNPADIDAVKEIRQMTRGSGTDVFVEYSGVASSLALAGEALAYGGQLRLLAVPENAGNTDFSKWVMKGLTIQGLHGRRFFSTWLLATKLLIDRKLDIRPVISDIVPLKQAPAAFEAAAAGQALKILISPR